MKRKIALISIVASLAASWTIYPQTMIVTDIDEQNDIVTISTCTGFEYQFEGVEDYFTGDLVSCIMYNNGTQNIKDDIIISQRYSGVTRFYDKITTPEY